MAIDNCLNLFVVSNQFRVVNKVKVCIFSLLAFSRFNLEVTPAGKTTIKDRYVIESPNLKNKCSAI
jgi:hypothetical protein